GFGVLLPDWVRRSRLGLKITTRTKRTAGASASKPGFGLGDLVDFRYDLAVGEEAIDPAELAELVRLKVPLVRLRGQWVELDDRHLQAAQRLAPVGTPATFRGELRPYQERGLAWMSFLGNLGLGGVLADSMGLGKTIQLLGLMAHERETARDDIRTGPTLLICPMSLVGNW